jgi:hypothetical protein
MNIDSNIEHNYVLKNKFHYVIENGVALICDQKEKDIRTIVFEFNEDRMNVDFLGLKIRGVPITIENFLAFCNKDDNKDDFLYTHNEISFVLSYDLRKIRILCHDKCILSLDDNCSSLVINGNSCEVIVNLDFQNIINTNLLTPQILEDEFEQQMLYMLLFLNISAKVKGANGDLLQIQSVIESKFQGKSFNDVVKCLSVVRQLIFWSSNDEDKKVKFKLFCMYEKGWANTLYSTDFCREPSDEWVRIIVLDHWNSLTDERVGYAYDLFVADIVREHSLAILDDNYTVISCLCSRYGQVTDKKHYLAACFMQYKYEDLVILFNLKKNKSSVKSNKIKHLYEYDDYPFIQHNDIDLVHPVNPVNLVNLEVPNVDDNIDTRTFWKIFSSIILKIVYICCICLVIFGILLLFDVIAWNDLTQVDQNL